MTEAVETIRVGLLGFGTVGQSVARILCSEHTGRVQLTHVFNRGVARKRAEVNFGRIEAALRSRNGLNLAPCIALGSSG